MIRDLKLYFLLGIFLGICVIGISVVRTTGTQPQRWTLPDSLREVSGLAVVSASELILHNDEDGVVYRFDLGTGELARLLTLGEDRPVKDDFEGIEVVGNDIYLVTSKGLLYKVPNGMAATGERIAFEIFDTNLSETCEIEGLVFDDGALLLPCKTAHEKQYKRKLTVFAWSLAEQNVSVRLSLPIKLADDTARVHPTAIEADEEDYFIVAAREHLLFVVGKETFAARSIALGADAHPQAEGIALLPDGSLVLADEGDRGVLVRYLDAGHISAARAD